jgi:hypothetical protein
MEGGIALDIFIAEETVGLRTDREGGEFSLFLGDTDIESLLRRLKTGSLECLAGKVISTAGSVDSASKVTLVSCRRSSDARAGTTEMSMSVLSWFSDSSLIVPREPRLVPLSNPAQMRSRERRA